MMYGLHMYMYIMLYNYYARLHHQRMQNLAFADFFSIATLPINANDIGALGAAPRQHALANYSSHIVYAVQ